MEKKKTTNKFKLPIIIIVVIVAIVFVILWLLFFQPNKLTHNPKDTDIDTIIKQLDGVKTTCLVTENNDPNGNLNKQGGYTGAVYFRLSQVDDELKKEKFSTPLTDDACKEGTDGGGQIEIYADKSTAAKRNDYLSTLDGFLSGGSHTQEGTLIIRISDKLTNSQQKGITTKIISLLNK